jgi:glycoside/pentoside/hexuronide:cation symporter, GPH family
MSNETQKLPLREKIGYGFGDLVSCLFWMTIMSQLLYFYIDIFGLTAKAAGVMFFVS